MLWIFNLELSSRRRGLSEEQKQKLKHFCKRFEETVFEFVDTEERKLDREQVIVPNDEVGTRYRYPLMRQEKAHR